MDRLNLFDLLQQKTADQLKSLAALCGSQRVSRKGELIDGIIHTMTRPESLRQLWLKLDPLSQKAVAAAYHNDGGFNEVSFIAQYGAVPERPRKSIWQWLSEPILLDLFIHKDYIPPDLMPLLAGLVPPPERFQVTGLANPPALLRVNGYPVSLIRAETEQAGRHDLVAYLRLVDQGQIKVSGVAGRATLASLKKIQASLLQGDFLPLAEKYQGSDTIRAYGLDIFAQQAKLVAPERGGSTLKLTPAGKIFYQSQAPEVLLEAFETWTESGTFDELTRIKALNGLRAKSTRLTRPASRREAIIEALSWCPAGIWIDIEEFYRAVKIWHFDFEVENSMYSNLYVGHRDYGSLYGENYWRLVKGLYINVILWEYLGSIGALDLIFGPAEAMPFAAGLDHYYFDDDYYSLYDGLKYFRINNLGAYLLGQAGHYVPAVPEKAALFTIAPNLSLSLTAPDQLTPNDQFLLEQLAVPQKKGRYQLDLQQLLTALEEGADLSHLSDFLRANHAGPLPEAVIAWLAEIEAHSQAFKLSGPALLIRSQSAELANLAVADPILGKLCKAVDARTLVIPANKEKQFRARLKALSYILAE
jgi:hypothetical protein